MASALDRASTARFTVGIATPAAGFIYDVANFGTVVGAWRLGLGLAGWFGCAGTTLSGETNAQGIETMIDATWFLAFVIAPAVVVAIGSAAVRFQERENRRHHPHPGE